MSITSVHAEDNRPKFTSKTIAKMNACLEQAKMELSKWKTDLCSSLEDDLQRIDEDIKKILSEHKKGNLRVVLLGDFSSGKSSMINALLKQNIAPIDIRPTTKVCTIFKYGPNFKITEITTQKNYKLKQYQNIVKSKQNDENKRIFKFVITCNCEALKGIELIDTMGLNDPENVEAKPTWEALSTADVVCYLLKFERGTLEEVQIADLKKYMDGSRKAESKIWIVLTNADSKRNIAARMAVKRKIQEDCEENQIICDKILPFCVRTQKTADDKDWKQYKNMQSDFWKELRKLAAERAFYHAQRLAQGQNRLNKKLERWNIDFDEWINESIQYALGRYKNKEQEIKQDFNALVGEECKKLEQYLKSHISYLEYRTEGHLWWKKYILDGSFSFKGPRIDTTRFGLTGKNSKCFRDEIMMLLETSRVYSAEYEKERGAKNRAGMLRRELIGKIIKSWKDIRLEDNRKDMSEMAKLKKNWSNLEGKLKQLNQQIREERICLK